MKGSKRNSNIELLRIICMALIVMGHFLGQSGAKEIMKSSFLKDFFIYILGMGANIGSNVFLIIACWFMIDRPFSADRVLKLYGTLWLYTGGGTMLLLILGYRIGTANIIRNLLPVAGGSLWFASAYIVLLFAAPYLNKVLAWDRTAVRNLLGLYFIFICLESMIRPKVDTWLGVMLWFPYVFLCTGYYKKYLYKSGRIRTGLFLCIGLGMYIGMCGIVMFRDRFVRLGIIPDTADRFLHEMFVAPNIMIAGSAFVFAIEQKPFHHAVINKIGAATFSVYVLHQFQGFYDILWKDVFHSGQWLAGPYAQILSVGVVIAVFAGAMVIDEIRKKTVEPLWVNSKVFKELSGRFNALYMWNE